MIRAWSPQEDEIKKAKQNVNDALVSRVRGV